MHSSKIESATQRLEEHLPIRRNQLGLPATLRTLHQGILYYYFETGHAPQPGQIDLPGDTAEALQHLAREKIIVLDESGDITGAYPFTNEQREFQVVSAHEQAYAMCAFDALSISPMFDEPVTIQSRCRVSGNVILLHQDHDHIRVIEPTDTVYAAIDWDARSATESCSASLCREMIFVSGQARADAWQEQRPGPRELFTLDEAYAVITAIFLPLLSESEDPRI